jgi:hypothetical protein
MQDAGTVLEVLRERGRKPAWAALMARKRRKTLIICRPCHDYIHASSVANAAQSLESPVH